MHRVSGLIDERLPHRIDRHVDDRPHAEAQQNTLLDPSVDAPAALLRVVGLGCADGPGVQRLLESGEEREMFGLVFLGRIIEIPAISCSSACSKSVRPRDGQQTHRYQYLLDLLFARGQWFDQRKPIHGLEKSHHRHAPLHRDRIGFKLICMSGSQRRCSLRAPSKSLLFARRASSLITPGI